MTGAGTTPGGTATGAPPAPDDAPLTRHLVGPGEMAGRTTAIVERWLAAGTPASEVAVLARVNSALLPVQVSLGEAGLPRTAPLDASVLGRTGIRTALAYLRLGLDPERIRRADVNETINRPARKVKGALEPFLRRDSRWSLSRLRDVADLLEGRNGDRLRGYCDDLQVLTDAITDGADTGACLAIIRDHIGLGEAMDVLDSSTTRPEGSSHGDDLDALAQLAHLHPDPVTFAEWLTDALRQPGDDDGVVLSTVHRVKGMEWDRVVVFAANRGLFPHRLATDEEEERRIFHVAITRCRRSVAVVGGEEAPSPFIDELHRPARSRPDPDEARTAPAASAPQLRPDGGVVAVPGLAVTVAGGFAATIVEVADGRAWARTADGIDLEVALGEQVAVDGRVCTLVAPERTGATLLGGANLAATDPTVVDPLFEALRAWRRRTAEAQGVPAYIVFPDRTLQAVAERQPRSPRQLADVPGVGPTKLERYGDDVLAIVDELV